MCANIYCVCVCFLLFFYCGKRLTGHKKFSTGLLKWTHSSGLSSPLKDLTLADYSTTHTRTCATQDDGRGDQRGMSSNHDGVCVCVCVWLPEDPTQGVGKRVPACSIALEKTLNIPWLTHTQRTTLFEMNVSIATLMWDLRKASLSFSLDQWRIPAQQLPLDTCGTTLKTNCWSWSSGIHKLHVFITKPGQTIRKGRGVIKVNKRREKKHPARFKLLSLHVRITIERKSAAYLGINAWRKPN